MPRLSRPLRWLAAALLVVGLGACDFSEPSLDDLEIILQVDDLPVDLGAGVAATVRPDQPTATTERVSTDFDVEAVNDLESITLRPDMFTFTAGVFSRTATAPAAASGTVTGFLFLGGYPVPGIPVTVTVVDDAITDVSPGTIASASSTIDRTAVNAFIASLPAAERPALADWGSLSAEEIRARISAALEEPTITVTIGYVARSADGSAPLVGTITLEEIDISAIITR